MPQDNFPDVEALVRELIDTGTMNSDSIEDLDRMLAEYQAGALHPDDADYLVAFHQRILSGPPPEAEEAPQALADRLAEALERAERAEAEVARLTALLAAREAGDDA